MTAGGAPQGADDNLMELLRQTLADVDGVPDDVVAAAKEVWTWRTIDAELAELAHDSLLDDAAMAGVRGTATLRALSFTAGSLFIEVEVSEDGDRRGLIGQVVPAPDPGAARSSWSRGWAIRHWRSARSTSSGASMPPASVRASSGCGSSSDPAAGSWSPSG